MCEVNVESHNKGPTSYRLTSLSFHVNLPSHSRDTTFQNLTLKIQGQGHVWGQSWKSQNGCNILPTHIPFVPCQLILSFQRFFYLENPRWRWNDNDVEQIQIQSLCNNGIWGLHSVSRHYWFKNPVSHYCGVSNHQPHDCLLNRSFRCRLNKTSKLHVTGLCAGNSLVTSIMDSCITGFPPKTMIYLPYASGLPYETSIFKEILSIWLHNHHWMYWRLSI